jgi:lipoprotein-releasing system permease protein
MSPNLPLFIGLRYLLPRRRNLFASLTTLFSLVGLVLGITALITVMSVMNGFEAELRTRILGMASHITISGERGRLDDWQGVAGRLLGKNPEVIGSAPFIEGQGLLSHGQVVRGVMVRGVLPEREPEVSTVADHMQRGRFDQLQPGKYRILLGKDLAAGLGVWPGDKVTLVTPQANITPAGVVPRLRRFTVAGVFEAGQFEFDNQLALIHLQDAGRLYQMRDQVSGLRLRVKDLFRAALVARELAAELPPATEVMDWTERHANFFGAVRTEQTVMFILLSLVVAVAAFNIVVTLVMVVSDKEADIAILRTIGATPGRIMGIFVVQGSFIGVVGTLLGTLSGVMLSLNLPAVVQWIETGLGVDFLPADVFYISEVPSVLNWNDVYGVVVLSLLLCLLATLYPSWRASQVQPAQSLRYE